MTHARRTQPDLVTLASRGRDARYDIPSSRVNSGNTGIDADVCLTRAEAAAWTKFSVGTLANWASKGEGPRYFRVAGKTRYRLDDLKAWLASHENAA